MLKCELVSRLKRRLFILKTTYECMCGKEYCSYAEAYQCSVSKNHPPSYRGAIADRFYLGTDANNPANLYIEVYRGDVSFPINGGYDVARYEDLNMNKLLFHLCRIPFDTPTIL